MSRKRLNKKEFVRGIYYQQEMGNYERIQLFLLQDVFDIFLENLTKALVEGEKVYLRGFGTFSPIRDNLMRGSKFVPSKGEFVDTLILRHHRVFKPSKNLLDRVNIGETDVFQRYFNDSDNS